MVRFIVSGEPVVSLNRNLGASVNPPYSVAASGRWLSRHCNVARANFFVVRDSGPELLKLPGPGRAMLNSALSEPRLSDIIEGIEATLTMYGRSLRVVVSAEALQASLGAGAIPDSWLTAEQQNARAIEQAARRAFAKATKDTVVVQRF